LGFDLVLGLGAKDNLALEQGQFWRFISPIFIHGDLIHVAVNMYSLFVLGPVIERFFGGWLMLVVYLLSGVAGVVASWYFTPQLSVGASGAIFGLLGALGGFLLVNRETFGVAGRMQFRQILIVALLNLTLGLSPGIDNWGHLGGLIFGVGLAWFICPQYQLASPSPDQPPRSVNRRSESLVRRSIVVGMALLLVLILFGLA
jgi:rhomboid protease GluP